MTITKHPQAAHAQQRMLLGAFLYLLVIRVWGRFGDGADRDLHVHAAPFVGTWQPLWSGRILVPVVAALLLVPVIHRITRVCSFRVAAFAASAAALCWAVSLTVIDGTDAWWRPLASRYDYLATLPLMRHGPAEFVRTFLDRYNSFPIHTQGHPPAIPVLLWLLDHAGLHGPRWAAALVLTAGAATTAVVGDTTRRLAGDHAGRAVLRAMTFAPMCIWWATSIDAIFMFVIATTVWTATIAGQRRTLPPSFAAGLLAGVALLMSYGAAPALLIVAAVLVPGHRGRSTLLWAATVMAVLLLAAKAGFWWPAGLQRTQLAYRNNSVNGRSYAYFLFANIAITAVAIGLQPVAFLSRRQPGRLRDAHNVQPRSLWLTAAVTTAVIASDLSGLSKGEAERVWLPYFPWILAIITAIPIAIADDASADHRSVPDTSMLRMVTPAAIGLLLAISLRTPW